MLDTLDIYFEVLVTEPRALHILRQVLYHWGTLPNLFLLYSDILSSEENVLGKVGSVLGLGEISVPE